MFINGQWSPAASGNEFDITNPATGAVIGTMPDGSTDDAVAAIEAATLRSLAGAPPLHMSGQTFFTRHGS